MNWDDISFGPVFPTRFGATLGKSEENRMLSSVGGPNSIRTKIVRQADGSEVMLRTRGGFPEFVSLSEGSQKQEEAIGDFYLADGPTMEWEVEDVAVVGKVYSLGSFDKIMDVFEYKKVAGVFARASRIRCTDDYARAHRMFKTEIDKLQKYLVGGIAYVGNASHGVVKNDSGETKLGSLACVEGNGNRLSPNLHLCMLNSNSMKLATSDGYLSNKALLTEANDVDGEGNYTYIYDWVRGVRVQGSIYECEDGTRYIITWSSGRSSAQTSISQTSEGMSFCVFAKPNAPTKFGGTTEQTTILETSLSSSATSGAPDNGKTYYTAIYVQPSPDGKRLCVEVYRTTEIKGIRAAAFITDVYEATISGGSKTIAPTVALDLVDSAASDGNVLGSYLSYNDDPKYVYASTETPQELVDSNGSYLGMKYSREVTVTPQETGVVVTSWLKDSTRRSVILCAGFFDKTRVQVMRSVIEGSYSFNCSAPSMTPISMSWSSTVIGGKTTTDVASSGMLPVKGKYVPTGSTWSWTLGSSDGSPVLSPSGGTPDGYSWTRVVKILIGGVPAYTRTDAGSVTRTTANTRLSTIADGVQIKGVWFSATPSYPTEPVVIGEPSYDTGLSQYFRTSNNTVVVNDMEHAVTITLGGAATEVPSIPPQDSIGLRRVCCNPITGEITQEIDSTWC